jgi:hypothetical protein
MVHMVLFIHNINYKYMFKYKYILPIILFLSVIGVNTAFAETTQPSQIIPVIGTYMWNDTLVVSIQGSSKKIQSPTKQYFIEYAHISKKTNIRPEYSSVDFYKTINKIPYFTVSKPLI